MRNTSQSHQGLSSVWLSNFIGSSSRLYMARIAHILVCISLVTIHCQRQLNAKLWRSMKRILQYHCIDLWLHSNTTCNTRELKTYESSKGIVQHKLVICTGMFQICFEVHCRQNNNMSICWLLLIIITLSAHRSSQRLSKSPPYSPKLIVNRDIKWWPSASEGLEITISLPDLVWNTTEDIAQSA